MKKYTALLLAGLLLILTACGLPLPSREEPAAGETAAPEELEPEPTPTPVPTPSVTLRLGADDGGARLAYAVDRLRTALPDIAVELTALPAEGEALPDLLLCGADRCAAWAGQGLLAELTEEPAALALLDRLAPAERPAARSDEDALFALPARGADVWRLYLNGAFFPDGLPQTVSELTAAAGKLAAPIALCLDGDGAALAFFEGVLTRHDERGINALLRGETSPYDETVHRAADELYRLGRAGAAALLDAEACEALWLGGGAAAIFAPESDAARFAEALGGELHLLRWSPVLAGEGEKLAVSADTAHRALAVDTACLLCEYLAAYDLQQGCGACAAIPDAAETEGAAAQELTALRRETAALTRLEPDRQPRLAAALAEGVRELLNGSMTPDEFVEAAAMTLDVRP